MAIQQTNPPKPTRPADIFAEAKMAQRKLDRLELQRRAIIDGLGDEAKSMLDALDECRARQTIEVSEADSPTAAASG